MHTQAKIQSAVVIGGSIAGLMTARVLSEQFAKVVIVERDVLPSGAENRKGVPQGRHAHALLGRGHQVMEELYPGLTAELVRQGAVLGNGRLFSGGGYLAKHPAATAKLYVSRPTLEAEVRRRTLAIANVRLLQNFDVTGLTSDTGRTRVTGVRVRERVDGAVATTVPAALVVDASGRGSHTPAWLEELGYPRPEEEVVEVRMGYASRLYARTPDDLGGDLMVNIAPTPALPIAAGMLAQDGDRWIVTLAGYFGDNPPTDDAGFLAFARRLPTQDVYDLISRATPLSDPVPFRFPSNLRRRYENMPRFPEGLLVIGDAVCSFTPIYGQGMSTAAMEVTALRACLAAGEDNLAARFFKEAAKAIDIPWALTVGNDRRLSGVKAPLPRRLVNWYMAKLQVAARRDPELALAFQNVGNLFAPPQSLLHPRLAWRVFTGSWRGAARPADTSTYAPPVSRRLNEG